MLKFGLGAVVLALLALQSPTVLAKTCDAGHGCKITCKNGCGAIYWPETKKCSKFCAEDDEATTTQLKMSKPASINGSFSNASQDDIIKMLTGESK